ncbi:MAG: hypothetical protein KJ569_03810, partial [Candidatus Omnitrophica bacterium]|nr:hypothetical protein [Candidatus Omnitrophota bacterium]MBU2504963.1 hypothetical protein [Candidatus Omnitrophota bacterium]
MLTLYSLAWEKKKRKIKIFFFREWGETSYTLFYHLIIMQILHIASFKKYLDVTRGACALAISLQLSLSGRLCSAFHSAFSFFFFFA